MQKVFTSNHEIIAAPLPIPNTQDNANNGRRMLPRLERILHQSMEQVPAPTYDFDKSSFVSKNRSDGYFDYFSNYLPILVYFLSAPFQNGMAIDDEVRYSWCKINYSASIYSQATLCFIHYSPTVISLHCHLTLLRPFKWMKCCLTMLMYSLTTFLVHLTWGQ
jgi:hypothetical protein